VKHKALDLQLSQTTDYTLVFPGFVVSSNSFLLQLPLLSRKAKKIHGYVLRYGVRMAMPGQHILSTRC